jgi:hypothetical protein
MAAVKQGSGARLWERLAWTIGLSLLPLGAKYVPLPGIDTGALPPALVTGNTSMGALGMSPLLSAFITVEIVAYVVPRWRRLRHRFPDGRARLDRAVAVLTLVLAAFQGFGIGMMLSSPHLGVDVQPVLVVGCFVLVTAGFIAAARRIDRLGLVSGVLALALVGHFSELVNTGLPGTTTARVVAALALLLPVAATWLAFRSRPGPASASAIELSIPASSLHPVVATVSLLGLPQVLASLGAPGARLLEQIAEAVSGPQRLGITTALTLLATLLLIWLLQPAPLVQGRLQALEVEPELVTLATVRRARRQTVIPTLAFVLVLLAAYQAAEAIGWWGGLAVQVALLTGLVLDATRAWRGLASIPDLVCVWEERRPYAVAPLLAAASRADIALLASGRATTGLLRAFGPFVAVRLWCRAADVEAAREVLGELLLAANEPVAPESALATQQTGVPSPSARWSPVDRVGAGALAVAAVGLLLWLHSGGPLLEGQTDAASVSAELEILTIDDEGDPLLRAGEPPTGVALYSEYLKADGDSVKRSYARLVLQPGESLTDAAQRSEPWITALKLPAGTRLVWEAADDSSYFRSYFVTGEAVLTELDIDQVSMAPAQQGGETVIHLELTPSAGQRFAHFTARHLGRRIAILVDGQVQAAPLITNEISGSKIELRPGGDPDDPAEIDRRARTLWARLTHRPPAD